MQDQVHVQNKKDWRYKSALKEWLKPKVELEFNYNSHIFEVQTIFIFPWSVYGWETKKVEHTENMYQVKKRETEESIYIYGCLCVCKICKKWKAMSVSIKKY